MLTKEQKKWLEHLSGDSKIKIAPFDPSCYEKFKKVKAIIKAKLGKATKVEHRGATRLGISGQDEIDVYVPVPPEAFDEYLKYLKELFGEPRSHYALGRARFVTFEEGKHVDVFLINEEHADWLKSAKFESYLLSHPEALEEYKKLKEAGDGLSVREYYRRKLEFINGILAKA